MLVEFGCREDLVNLAYAPVDTKPRSLANVREAWVSIKVLVNTNEDGARNGVPEERLGQSGNRRPR